MANIHDHADSDAEPSVYYAHVRKTVQLMLSQRDPTQPVNSFSDVLSPEEAAVAMQAQQEGLSCVQAARKVLASRKATAVRDFSESTINNLYGCPGANYETEKGVEILTDLLESWGFLAFTDEFLAALAQEHRDEDWRSAHRKRA